MNFYGLVLCLFTGLVFSSNSADDGLQLLGANVAIGSDLKCEIGCYDTESTNVQLPDYDCGDGTHRDGTVHLYFPKNLDGTFPIVSFLHGSGGGNFGAVCSTIASLGFVVVAPAKDVCGDLSNQQMHSIWAAEQNQDVHPAFSHVDYERIGVMGHSQGGAFTMGSAASWDPNHKIKAAVASHGQSANAAPHLPEKLAMMYSTGTSDPKTHKLWWAYSSTKSRPNVFYNLHGAAHMEPTHEGHSNEFTAHFLNCHVKPNQYSCYKIYGDGPQTMCKKYDADCTFQTPEYRSPMTTGYYFGEIGSQCEGEDTVIQTSWECELAMKELQIEGAQLKQNVYNTNLPAGCSFDGDLFYNWNTNLDETIGDSNSKPVCKSRANCDTVRAGCCAYNTKYGMIPWVTWGTTPESEKDWFHEHNCDAVMGESSLRNCPYTCNSEIFDVQDLEESKSTQVVLKLDQETTTSSPPCSKTDSESFAFGLVLGGVVTIVFIAIVWFFRRRTSRNLVKASGLQEPCLHI